VHVWREEVCGQLAWFRGGSVGAIREPLPKVVGDVDGETDTEQRTPSGGLERSRLSDESHSAGVGLSLGMQKDSTALVEEPDRVSVSAPDTAITLRCGRLSETFLQFSPLLSE
jgi:hypothetical protein